MSDRWMDTEEAAPYSKYAVSTFEKFRTYGGGPRFHKRGRKVLYKQSDLDAWLSEIAVLSTSELREVA